jgi:hypothetical protein
MKFNDQQIKVIANNEENMVDAFKLRINSMEWQFSHYGLTEEWHFKCVDYLSTDIIAKTCREKRTIEINIYKLYFLTWDMVKNVMLHEIAHALTPNDTEHGKEWQDKCQEMGIPAIVTLSWKNLEKIGEDLYKIEYKEDIDFPII